MIATRALPNTIDHDAVMSWLQDRELKDRKLGEARGGRGRSVDIWSAIDRTQEQAHLVFPHIDEEVIHSFIREYIDPLNIAKARPR